MSNSISGYFVVEITGTGAKPSDADFLAQRTFVEELDRKGELLLSGPLTDTPGKGMAIVKSPSVEELHALYENAPLVKSGLATFSVRAIHIMFGTVLK